MSRQFYNVGSHREHNQTSRCSQETFVIECRICDKEAKMTHDLTDPRVQRTRKLLKDALVELSANRGFDKVTVGDIVERAKINRATFYRHYQDKYALVEEIFQEAIERLRHDLKPPNESALKGALQDPPARLVKLFEHFAEHNNLYRALRSEERRVGKEVKRRADTVDSK